MLGKAALGLKCGMGAVTLCALLLAPPGLLGPAFAAEKDLTDKGKVLVEQNCGRCHATGKEGDSPHKEAPPFRTLSSKYPVEDLAESLAEGIVSGHPEMPIFVFEPQDVAAIIDYLESIQDVPSAPPGEAPAGAPAETPPQAE
jgi:mono/diheme cytochrome c family protein